MGQALYRKYRTRTLAETVGQEHITATLESAVKQGRISHAYLLTGPRGVGKTSVARILAHLINDLDYDDDRPHFDIIEIDAASNRRIDEIRDLRDKVYIAPTEAKYKVYIIDEVHMLTKEAFNALLKTLEEPPAHVVFILATTDAHKLPETIISRTQRYNFRPVSTEKVVAHLKYIADKENIQVSDAALKLLAEHGEGSFRDSISVLDQAAGSNQAIDEEFVERLLGLPPLDSIDKLIRALVDQESPANLIQILESLYDQGLQASAIAKSVSDQLRSGLLNDGLVLDYQQTLKLLKQLSEVKAAYSPERILEIIFLEQLSLETKPDQQHKDVDQTPASKPEATRKSPIKKEAPIAEKKEVIEETKEAEETVSQKTKEKKAPVEAKMADTTKASVGHQEFNDALWPELLDALKKRYNTLYGVIRMAQPTFSDDNLTLAFAFAFHQKRVNEAANRKIIVDTIHAMTGQDVQLELVVDKKAKPQEAKTITVIAPEEDAKNLEDISNIFKGAEVLES